MKKKLLSAAVLCLALTGVAGCDNALFSSGDKGFVSGNGEVKIVPAADRQAPDEISGTTVDGHEVALSDLKGKIVVMPVWGSWCPPCRAEAPMFETASKELADQNVVFLGLNVRDTSAENAQAFMRTTGITYPSIRDSSGSVLLSFHAGMTPSVIPSVAFIDADGKVAAAVLGEITRTTLYDVIEEIQK